MSYRETRLSTPDGLQLHSRCWLPDGQPTAAVVLIHGLAEHGGRYAPVAERLTADAYAAYALDLRGHGLSGGPRIYIDSFQQYLDDVTQFLQEVRTELPNRPIFLFGHSMGGLIATWLATQNISGICGIVISAAAVQIHNRVFPMLRWLAMPASWLTPRWRVVAMNFSAVSRDPKVVASMASDPLVYHGRMPNRTAGELLRAGAQLPPRLAAIAQPLLILHGTGDRITAPQGAQQFYQQAGAADKTLKLYDGLYHNLLEEPEKERVIADVLGWLNARRDRRALG